MSSLFKIEPESVIGLDVIKQLDCEYPKCKGKLVWWGARFLKFPMNKEASAYGHACDIIMICPECGLLHMFGHPISKEHWEKCKLDSDDVSIRDNGSILYSVGKPDG